MTTPAQSLRQVPGGVARRDSTGAASEAKVPGAPVADLHREVAELVERVCSRAGTKEAAAVASILRGVRRRPSDDRQVGLEFPL